MKKKVIIIGGGVAGMSAAHELIERGFDVEVYEIKSKYVGGKARSIDVIGTNNKEHPDKFLPGEHGFRFFPGFYKHVTDTMKRIPFKDKNGKANKDGVFDNLTKTTRIMLTRYNDKPIRLLANFPKSKKDLGLFLYDLFGGIDTGLTKEEEIFFTKRVWQMMTSCDARRSNDYEKISWWKFLEADRFSDTYRHLLVEGLTRTLVAARAEIASMKTGSNITLQLMYNMVTPGVDVDRVLNGPTNEKWLDPWYDYLQKSGVKYFKSHKGLGFDTELNNESNTVITAARVKNLITQEEIKVKGDYYILCAPVERAAEIIENSVQSDLSKMIDADDQFQYLPKLAESTAWMNGIQYYLNKDVTMAHGHVCHSYTEWAITSISQVQFWKDYDLSIRFNGKVKGVLSVDISDWLYTKYKSIEDTSDGDGVLAENCTPKEVSKLVWEQIKRSVNIEREVLTDDMIEYWYLDRDIRWNPLIKDSAEKEPLLVNTVNSWSLRPTSYTLIPNFFLASDYVRTNTDLATMEGANEAARRAVNDIIEISGSDAKSCEIWPLSEPTLFSPLKWYDNKRFEQGLPYSSHIPAYLKIFMEIYTPLWLLVNFIRLKLKKKND